MCLIISSVNGVQMDSDGHNSGLDLMSTHKQKHSGEQGGGGGGRVKD